MRNWQRLTLLAMTATFAVACRNVAVAPDAPLDVRLLAFNDFHGYLDPPGTPTRWTDAAGAHELSTGGVARLASLIHSQRAAHPNTAVVAAGDLIGGAPLLSAQLRHEPTIEALSDAGLEFSSVGNHEFDRGWTELLRLQNGGCHPSGQQTCANGPFGGARFKYLAANVRKENDGATVLPAWSSKRFTAGRRSVEVAFIGLVLRDTPSLVTAESSRGLRFEDEADAANALVPVLRARGIETIVVLIHEGGRITAPRFDDLSCPGFNGPVLRIVERLDPAIDVVVSGHTHRAYVCRHAGKLVTSAGNEGRFLTAIDLRIDPSTRDVVVASGSQLAVVNATPKEAALAAEFPVVPEEPTLAAKVAHWRDALAPITNRIVGHVAEDLTRRSDANGETTLGETIADAHLDATRDPEHGGALVAFMNNGGLRADLRAKPQGLTYDEIFAVHPFGNTLVTMTLTGAQIRTLLETQWQGAGSLLQVSAGFRYVVRLSESPGSRVDPTTIELNGARVDPRGTYRVTVNDFLAGGGDGYRVLLEGTSLVSGPLDVDVLEQRLKTHSPIRAPAGGRSLRIP